MPTAVDRCALKILSNTYWSTGGWRTQPETPPDDFSHATAAGLMFDPIRVTHDQAVVWALRSRTLVSKEAVVAGFLASLSSRRLDLRSALGSFAVLRHFPLHRWCRTEHGEHCCPVLRSLFLCVTSPEFVRRSRSGRRHSSRKIEAGTPLNGVAFLPYRRSVRRQLTGCGSSRQSRRMNGRFAYRKRTSGRSI